jgi:hypothetical protein
MTKYIIKSKYLTEPIELRIVQSLGGGGSHATIIYESPGSNGGVLIGTGRTNETMTMGGLVLSKYKYPSPISVIQDDINNRAAELQDIKDLGYPIVIEGNLPTNKTGEYVMTDFNWTKAEGQRRYVGFTMTLQEHRQMNIKRNQVNLIGAESVRKMKETKEALGLV